MKDHPDWGPYVFFYKTKNGRSHRMRAIPSFRSTRLVV